MMRKARLAGTPFDAASKYGGAELPLHPDLTRTSAGMLLHRVAGIAPPAGKVGAARQHPPTTRLVIRLARGFVVAVLTSAVVVTHLHARESASDLELQISPRLHGAPVAFDTFAGKTAAGRAFSITRLDLLLSDFALRTPDGGWLEITNQFGFIGAREGRTNVVLKYVPHGHYDRVRFHVGLAPEANHRDPSGYPASDPLNPLVNGLHWGWSGGYVFFAMEGHWLAPAGDDRGFSYHLATDRQLMTVILPINCDPPSNRVLRIALDVDRIFTGRHAIALTDATSSTHSRTNDAVADQLRENIEDAFSVIGTGDDNVCATTKNVRPVPLVASNATPYRLAISRFFPRPSLPADNPLTVEGVELGRHLFFNSRLSVNDSQSCASCHSPARAFTEARAVSIGAEGGAGRRNAMPLFNLAWKSAYFWDGRAATLREQVLQPIQNPIEMHESLTNLERKLRGEASQSDGTNYPALFSRAFGNSEITADRISRAIEQFLLAQVSYHSKFDRVIEGRDQFTAEEQRGFELFHTEYDPAHGQFGADCFHCHGGPLFQSQAFANNGLDADPADTGRFTVTGQPGDRGKFAVPSLRNVELTAPYMHDGRFATLEEAVAHYCNGVKRSATLDPNLARHPDGGVPLSPSDQRALVAFLKTLTDEQYRSREP